MLTERLSGPSSTAALLIVAAQQHEYEHSHDSTPPMKNGLAYHYHNPSQSQSQSITSMTPEIRRCSTMKKQRTRTSFSPEQLIALQNSFSDNHTPCQSTRQVLSQTLGLSEKTIRYWFQNRRQKVRDFEKRPTSSTPEKLSDRPDNSSPKLMSNGSVNRKMSNVKLSSDGNIHQTKHTPRFSVRTHPYDLKTTKQAERRPQRGSGDSDEYMSIYSFRFNQSLSQLQHILPGVSQSSSPEDVLESAVSFINNLQTSRRHYDEREHDGSTSEGSHEDHSNHSADVIEQEILQRFYATRCMKSESQGQYDCDYRRRDYDHCHYYNHGDARDHHDEYDQDKYNNRNEYDHGHEYDHQDEYSDQYDRRDEYDHQEDSHMYEYDHPVDSSTLVNHEYSQRV
eukprot:CFRG8285T1